MKYWPNMRMAMAPPKSISIEYVEQEEQSSVRELRE